jgi:saccharopine dehydrogenase (NAD+, L-lysine-forming)
MLYGANGYTGTLIAELAARRGERPVLAGRSEEKIAPLADRLGLEHRSFALSAAQSALEGVEVVLHCAGPFSATSAPLVDACLATGTHYADVTGEIDVFEAVAARDADARGAGVVLLPGVGFDVVPTDCLAALLVAELPSATSLDLAFTTGGGASPGTARTALEGGGGGGRVRVGGELRRVPMAHRTIVAEFPSGPRRVASIPWGDVSTAHRSTGVPDITTYTVLPGLTGPLHGLVAPLLRAPAVRRAGLALAGKLVRGPGERTRATSRCEVWGRVRDETGRTVSGALSGPNPYDLTADSALRAVRRLLAGDVPAGTHTPSSAFGADFVRELDGVVVGGLVAGEQ